MGKELTELKKAVIYMSEQRKNELKSMLTMKHMVGGLMPDLDITHLVALAVLRAIDEEAEIVIKGE